MEAHYALIVAVVSYLIGSVSFARVITRWWSGRDVTLFEIPVEQSKNRYKVLSIGANSVSSELGAAAGMTVSLLDILKVVLPTLFCRLYFTGQPEYMLVAATAGLCGHVWPVYYGFHGGSGFSAILGGLLVIDPLAILVANLTGLALGMLVFRNLIVASLSWIWLLIPWFWWRFSGDFRFILFSLALNIIFILAMIPEIMTGLKYKREGRVLEYGIGTLSSNPMGRGMLKMARALGFMKQSEKGE